MSDAFCVTVCPVLEPARNKPAPTISTGTGMDARQAEQWVGKARSYRDCLHRIFPRSGGNVVHQLLAPAFDIVRHLSLDGVGADTLANFARGVGDTCFQLFDCVGQAGPRLFGFAFDLL